MDIGEEESGKQVKERRKDHNFNIPTMISHHSLRTKSAYSVNTSRSSNHNNLIAVPRIPLQQTSTSYKDVKFCLLNSRSIRNKTTAIKDFVLENCVDIFALTEAWLQNSDLDEYSIRNITPANYAFRHASAEEDKRRWSGLNV